MGDRGQVRVVHTRPEDEHGSVYLYTHHGGTELPGSLYRGLLAGRSRWDDEEYLSRVIFDWVVDQAAWRQHEMGYGIGLQQQDDLDHPVLVVRPNYPGGSVSWEARDGSGEMVMTFEHFVMAKPETWKDLHALEDKMRAALLREAGE